MCVCVCVCVLEGGGTDTDICIGSVYKQLSTFFTFFFPNKTRNQRCAIFVAGQPADPAGPVPATDTDARSGRIQGKGTELHSTFV